MLAVAEEQCVFRVSDFIGTSRRGMSDLLGNLAWAATNDCYSDRTMIFW
jgi:hypothetical protein